MGGGGRDGKKVGSWKTRPGSGFALVIAFAPIRSSPELGKSSPAMRRRRVDFPQALGPMMEMNSPAATEKETPSNASVRRFVRTLEGKSLATIFACNEKPSVRRR